MKSIFTFIVCYFLVSFMHDSKQEKLFPVMEVSQKIMELDDVKAGEEVSFSYNFKNTGNAPLLIKDFKVACTCTKVSFPKEPIVPNQEGIIAVNFDTKGKHDLQDRTINLITNTKKKTVKLRFRIWVKE